MVCSAVGARGPGGSELALTCPTLSPRNRRCVTSVLALLLRECQHLLLPRERMFYCGRQHVGTRIRRVPTRPISPLSVYGGHHMKLKPLGDRLIVRAIEEEETTA